MHTLLSFKKNSVVPLFIEFADPLSTSHSIIIDSINNIKNKINNITENLLPYDDAYRLLTESQEYKEAERNIEKEFMWKIGKYNIDIIVTHDNNKQTHFLYNFTISDQEYFNLKNNIHELIVYNLKQLYNKNIELHTSNISLYEK